MSSKNEGKFDANVVKHVHGRVREALEKVLAEEGIRLEKTSCRYSDMTMKFSIEVMKDDPDAKAQVARERHRFEFQSLGIDYGTIVTDRRGVRKFSVECFNRGGKLGARDLADNKVYFGKPEAFFLNGKPLAHDWNRYANAASKTKSASTTCPCGVAPLHLVEECKTKAVA